MSEYPNFPQIRLFPTKFSQWTVAIASLASNLEPEQEGARRKELYIDFEALLVDLKSLNSELPLLSEADQSQVLVINAEACLMRLEMTKSIADLDRSIITTEQVLTLTPTELRIHLLNSLSLALQKWSEKSGLTTDLDRIVETKEQMVEYSTKSASEHTNLVNNLANALQR